MTPRLSPVLPANLIWLSDVDSTNEAAARLVASWPEDEEGRLADIVLVAAKQQAGRGRGAHSWLSPPGGLYASWLAWVPSDRLPALPLAVGASLAAAVEELLPGCRVALKWPNDLLVGGCKLGGVLCQSRLRGDWCWVVAGFGVNIGVAPVLDNYSSGEATSLAKLGYEGDGASAIWALVGGFLTRIRAALDDPTWLRAVVLERTVHRPGDPMRIRSGGEVVQGVFAGFGPEGQLELEVSGTRRSFAAAELVTPLPELGG